MKKFQNILAACMVISLFSATAAFAQDDGFNFESSDSGFSFDGSGDSSSGFEQALAAVTISGTVKMDARAYLDDPANDGSSDGENSPTKVEPNATLNFNYSGESSEVELRLNFSKDSIKNFQEDVIEEAIARSYLGSVILEGGKEKLVWGKGDKLHVLDNFCATDYTDFLYPDYIDRRLAVPMFRAIYNAPSGMMRAEAVWAPVLVTDRLATSGYWVPAQSKALVANVKGIAQSVLAPSLTGTLDANTVMKMSAASNLSADILMPDTNTLKYSQYGARVTGTIGSFDWGLSYYYGFNKQPSVNGTKLVAYITDYINNNGSSNKETGIDFDRLQVFGFEGAKALGRFNTRFELAYNLTDDVAGDDPFVRNNSISWVPGIDFDIPIHNININIQEIGSVILKSDKIKDNATDNEKDANDCYTNNKIAVAISDSFMHENLKIDLLTTYGFERGDLVIQPKVTYTVKTGMDLIASGMYLHCKDENSEFYAWRNNSFAQIGVKYMF